MAEIVQVNHEALNTIANKFTQQSEDVAQMVQNVQNAMSRLQSDWIGRGSEAFFSEMEGEILPALVRLADALAQAGAVTRDVNQVMQEADEEASSPFKDRSLASGGGAVGAGVASGAGAGAGIGGFGASIFGNAGLLGGSRFGNVLGSNFFSGNLFGEGVVMPGAGNDYGIPRDWLSGVTDSLQGYMKDNYNDHGIPKDWLEGVKDVFDEQPVDSPAAAQEAPASGNGGSGGGSGGGASGGSEESGGGSGGGAGSPEPTLTEPSTMPGSFGGAGSPQSEISSPYSSGSSFTRNFSGGEDGGEAATVGLARLKYQPFGGVIGGGSGAAPAGGGGSSSGGVSGGGAPAQETSPSQAGFLPIGIAAASPFVALLGKALKKKGDD